MPTITEPSSEPPPPPEPPKARHPLAWLVFLTPSGICLLVQFAAPGLAILSTFISLLFCFYLGDVLDAWVFKPRYNFTRGIILGFCILFINALVVIAGCVVTIRFPLFRN